jgi:GntR family transcriptional repressor for pyruvate dehydrogenase complex
VWPRPLALFAWQRDDAAQRNAASLFELRAILEVEAAGLAATRRSGKHLGAINKALQTLYDCQGSGRAVEADLEFHRTIARASDNAYVATFVNFISEHVRTSIANANARIDSATASESIGRSMRPSTMRFEIETPNGPAKA